MPKEIVSFEDKLKKLVVEEMMVYAKEGTPLNEGVGTLLAPFCMQITKISSEVGVMAGMSEKEYLNFLDGLFQKMREGGLTEFKECEKVLGPVRDALLKKREGNRGGNPDAN